MGKVFIYGMGGLISLALLFGLGFTVKMIVMMFKGKAKKRAEAHEVEDRYCHCGNPDTCPQYGPYRLHKHDRS